MVSVPEKTTFSLRIDMELAERIDALAERLNCTRSDVLIRTVRNGTDELEQIMDKCENPIINFALKIAFNLAGNEEERQQIIAHLDEITERRRLRNQEQLPGLTA